MDEREPIQVSFRLPAGTLEGLNRLVEQLRLLAAEVNGGAESPAAPPAEYGRNDGFDRQRYDALRTEPESAQTVRAEFSGVEDPQAVSGKAERHVEAPAEASGEVEQASVGTQDASGAKDAAPDAQERPAEEPAPQERREEPAAVRAEADGPVEGPEAVRAEAESPVEVPEAVRLEPESQIPAAEAVWTESGGEHPAAQAVEINAFSDGAEVRSAGFALGAVPAEVPGKWNGVTQELAQEGPAPLTAEAVSLAFRRDGRRYDNGFPLY